MPTAQPGQEQRMENAREMLIRRRKDAESLGGSAEIATEELDEAIAALTRPTADLGEDGELVRLLIAAVLAHTKAGPRETLTVDVSEAMTAVSAVLSRSGG